MYFHINSFFFLYFIINFYSYLFIYIFIKGRFFCPSKMVNVAPHTSQLAIFHAH